MAKREADSVKQERPEKPAQGDGSAANGMEVEVDELVGGGATDSGRSPDARVEHITAAWSQDE
eukprot:3419420-Alexandrium_andersonii.AAC.1